MRLTRRTVLHAGMAALPSLTLPALTLPSALRAQDRGATVSVLLDGIDAKLDPVTLTQVVAPFLAANLPVTCIADLVALTTGTPAGRGLCDELARLALQNPGLVDIGLPVGKLGRTERYYQLRRAGELRDALVQAFAKGPAAAHAFPVVTLVDRGEDDNIDHTAFRGAGFRAHVRAGDGPYEQKVIGRGEQYLSGGIWTALDADDLPDRVKRALTEQQDLVLSVSLAGNSATLADRAGALAAQLAAAQGDGRAQLVAPAQLRLYAGDSLPVDMALLVEPGTTPEESDAVLTFVQDLAAVGLPLTLGGRAERFGDLPGSVQFCPASPTEPGAATPPAACLRDRPGAPPALSLPVAIHVAAEPAIWTQQGIGADGRLILTPRDLGGRSPDAALDMSPLEDHVVVITPDDVMQPVRRAVLLRRLTDAAMSRRAYFHTLPGLAAHLVETEPVLARLWSVRRRTLTDPWREPVASSDETARLIDDARLAWRFVDRFTDDTTGLCAGTVQMGARPVINRQATLWDLASQLHAIRTAGQLALIEPDEAKDRTRRLLDHLPVTDVDGYRLPPAMFRTGDGGVVTPGFDICDLGRFLIALRASVAARLVEKDVAQALVDGWDLVAALPEGRPHSHFSGKWVDTTLSHCTPYSRRGLADWDLAVASPYPGLAQGSATDRQIALLYDVARIGQVGVEPVLLERIELGPDPEADLIADVLFDAQLTWWEQTGQLKCASEAPLNFAPWFSYQGLRFGYLGDAAWVVRGLGGSAEHDTPEFRAKAELLSTKSAYLWAATRQHAYCDQLLAVMRDKTRIDGLGFSVGVFTATEKPMANYTDLNTNGVILTAIGHMLR